MQLYGQEVASRLLVGTAVSLGHLPDPDRIAVGLLDRARLSEPRFELTDRLAWAAVQICRRLDGIPLAIELAASRTKVLSLDQIAAPMGMR